MTKAVTRLFAVLACAGATASATAQVQPIVPTVTFAQPVQTPGSMPVATPIPAPYVLDEKTIAARELVEVAQRLETAEPPLRDIAHARALYCSAAQAGYPEAFVRLGWMYANGRGVKRSDAIAYTLFKRAGELGSDIGQRLAQMLSSPAETLPPCLRPPGEVAAEDIEEVERSAPPGLPQPTVASPAQFRSAPPSADRRRLAETVVRLARQYMLDPRLVFAVIQTESGFDPTAKSPKNAQGLMQLIPDTAERFAVKNIMDPLDNLRGGMTYLRWLLAYFRGDVVLALAAYNAGEGAVDKYKGVPPFSETLAYVQKIRAIYPFDSHPYDPNLVSPSAAVGGRTLRSGVTSVRASGG